MPLLFRVNFELYLPVERAELTELIDHDEAVIRRVPKALFNHDLVDVVQPEHSLHFNSAVII